MNASQNDKDYVAAVNYKKAEECVASGKAKAMPATYYHDYTDPKSRIATAEKKTSVKVIDPPDCEGIVYYLPTPKSPHGVDVDPTGEYIVAGGKLATVIPVHSFTKLTKAIEAKQFDSTIDGIPVLKYDAILAGEVRKPGLGPLHTEFDGKGNGYTSMFISSEDVSALMGYTGAVFEKFFGSAGGTAVASLALVLWTGVPLLLGARRFQRKNF